MYIYVYIDISYPMNPTGDSLKTGGTPKCRVYKEDSHLNGWLGGTPIYGNPHMSIWKNDSHLLLVIDGLFVVDDMSIYVNVLMTFKFLLMVNCNCYQKMMTVLVCWWYNHWYIDMYVPIDCPMYFCCTGYHGAEPPNNIQPGPAPLLCDGLSCFLTAKSK